MSAEVAYRVPTDRVAEGWRAICQDAACLAPHKGWLGDVYWHTDWSAHDAATEAAAAHNEEAHPDEEPLLILDIPMRCIRGGSSVLSLPGVQRRGAQ